MRLLLIPKEKGIAVPDAVPICLSSQTVSAILQLDGSYPPDAVLKILASMVMSSDKD